MLHSMQFLGSLVMEPRAGQVPPYFQQGFTSTSNAPPRPPSQASELRAPLSPHSPSQSAAKASATLSALVKLVPFAPWATTYDEPQSPR